MRAPSFLLRFTLLVIAAAAMPRAAVAQRADAPAAYVARAAALPRVAPPVLAMETGVLAAPAERTVAVDSARLSNGRPELPLAVLGGAVGGTVGYGAGLVLLDCQDESINCGSGPRNGEYKTMAIGIALGAGTGAYLGGKRRDSRGTWIWNVAAAGLGAIPAAIPDEHGSQNGGAWIGLAGAAVAATLADYLIRNPRY